ncbi:MAG TPA: hypothetical protein PLX89_19610 [Verrucomicrobiota bacterium]|nr:hypothetical protein [Verrucomicrobiales bacterium]HRI15208.1 hypothetical protein [Verrucomicrobiota bacterium]
MNPCESAAEILPGIYQWSGYSPQHRVVLSSTAVLTDTGWWVFDPIPLAPVGKRFLGKNEVMAIVLTNENHERAAGQWASELSTEIWAAPDAALGRAQVRRWTSVAAFPGWTLCSLPGGAGGETAWFQPRRSLMVFGDAVVNLPDRSLEILPDKYCRDPSQLRRSLRRLPAFEHAVFAHGEPLLGGAALRLAALL